MPSLSSCLMVGTVFGPAKPQHLHSLPSTSFPHYEMAFPYWQLVLSASCKLTFQKLVRGAAVENPKVSAKWWLAFATEQRSRPGFCCLNVLV